MYKLGNIIAHSLHAVSEPYTKIVPDNADIMVSTTDAKVFSTISLITGDFIARIS